MHWTPNIVRLIEKERDAFAGRPSKDFPLADLHVCGFLATFVLSAPVDTQRC